MKNLTSAICLLMCISVTAYARRLKGCTHRLKSNNDLETICRVYARADAITLFSISSKPQGLFLVDTLVSRAKIDRTTTNVSMGLARMTVTKSSLDQLGGVNVFEFSYGFRLALMLVDRFRASLTLRHRPHMAWLQSSNGAPIVQCLADDGCFLQVLGDDAKLFFNVGAKIQFQAKAVGETLRQIFGGFLDQWGATKNNSIVESLSISFVHLNTLQSVALWMKMMHLINIQNLTLADSQLVSLGDKSIFNMPDVESLSFSKNMLDKIPTDIFDHLVRLRNLDLSHNNLDGIPIAISGLPNLKSLDVRNNWRGFKNFRTRVGNFTSHVSTLRLSDNNIQEIKAETFESFPDLQSLELKNCQIRRIHPDAFRGVQYLTFLDMSENPITTVDANSLVSLTRMTKLRMSDCRLDEKESGPRFLERMKNLVEVSLDGNNFQTIRILQLTNATSVSLDDNAIESWVERVLLGPRKPNATLSLRRNKITVVTEAMKEDFAKFSTVRLDGNPFRL